MPRPAPDLASPYRRPLDQAVAIANALLDGTSRIEKLLLAATREEIESRCAFMKALGTPDAAGSIGTLQAAFLRDKPSDLVHLQSELMQIAQDTQQALVQSIEVLELGDDAPRVDPLGPWLAALMGAAPDASDSSAALLGPMQGLIDLWRNQMTATIRAFDRSLDQIQAQGIAAVPATSPAGPAR